MDLIQLSEQLKGVQDQYLQQQIANPSGSVPPYLALSELNRRKQLRSQTVEPPRSTVAQDVLMQPPPMMPGMGGMGGTDMLSQQPQPQMPQMPQGGMPQGGGLAAMTPPRPQGPPAPQRMARGGLVGTGEDRILGKGNTYWGDGVVRMQFGGGITRAPGGGWNYRIKGHDYAVTGRPEFRFPEWQEPEAITVPRPKLEDFLGEVRAITGEPEGYVSPLEKRISELEAQRTNIRRPTFSQGLIEAGLGMMASKALTPGQAFGEAAGSAFQNYQARQMMADQREQQITERLAGLDASREEMARRSKMEDLRAASELASRQYGANMVEAQARAQREASRRNWEMEKYKAEQAGGLGSWGIETGLQMEAIKQALRPEEVSPLQQHNWRLEEIAAQGTEHRKSAAAAAARAYGGYGGRPMGIEMAREVAERLIREQAGKWGVGEGDTSASYLDRLKGGLAGKVLSGELLPEGLHPQSRELIGSVLRNWEPNKTGDPKFSSSLDDYIAKGVAAARTAREKNAPATFAGGTAMSGDVKGGMTIANPFAASGSSGGSGGYTPPSASAGLGPAIPTTAPQSAAGRSLGVLTAEELERGQKMKEFFGGADPDDPRQAGAFANWSPDLIDIYRRYLKSPEGRRIY